MAVDAFVTGVDARREIHVEQDHVDLFSQGRRQPVGGGRVSTHAKIFFSSRRNRQDAAVVRSRSVTFPLLHDAFRIVAVKISVKIVKSSFVSQIYKGVKFLHFVCCAYDVLICKYSYLVSLARGWLSNVPTRTIPANQG